MALYAYEAFNKDGKKVHGTVDATSVGAVRHELARQQLYPITIYLATDQSKMGFFKRLMLGRVALKEVILFTKQLSVLLKSAVPLLQSLELLTEQFKGRLHSILVTIKDEVKGGTAFADALAQFPKVFDTIYVQLVRAGEASGQLDDILVRLTDYLERREEIRKKIKSAMQYPLIQLVMAVGVVMILMLAVVPQLESLFEAQGENLPWATKVMISMSRVVQHYFVYMLIAFVIITVSFIYWKRTATGGYYFDKLKLKLPVVKYITKTNAVVQFCYTLGILLESGVNLAEALDIVVKIMDNRILAATLTQARDNIIKQGNIAQYLKDTDIFPPIAIHLIRTGEQTGELGKMLLTVAQNYEVELSDHINTATGLLGPAMMIFMGVIVGFIVMAIAMPLMGGAEAFGLEAS